MNSGEIGLAFGIVLGIVSVVIGSYALIDLFDNGGEQ